MVEGKGSTLVHVLVIALSLTAFGFAIAAERRRSTVSLISLPRPKNRSIDPVENGQFINNNPTVKIRLTFLIAAACLIAGATKNAYHTKYRHVIYAQNWTCESLRKGVFIAGAVFVVFTMILNVYYYMYFTKATSQAAGRPQGQLECWNDRISIAASDRTLVRIHRSSRFELNLLYFDQGFERPGDIYSL
uniref:Transmembrane protein n=1 Tax=Ananas comosus var. bracteatus TaxID=296719 RepID=A0A6V7Q5Y0_ANACO|nr:unnamed protein product [Ananas comosus var. bracteatus]